MMPLSSPPYRPRSLSPFFPHSDVVNKTIFILAVVSNLLSSAPFLLHSHASMLSNKSNIHPCSEQQRHSRLLPIVPGSFSPPFSHFNVKTIFILALDTDPAVVSTLLSPFPFPLLSHAPMSSIKNDIHPRIEQRRRHRLHTIVPLSPPFPSSDVVN